MDIGITLPQSGPTASAEAIGRVAQEAERLGYASVWVLERLLRPTQPRNSPGGGRGASWPAYYANVYDPIETLTYAAAKTERIKLGTSILIAPLHVPVVLARRLATLDQLSGGRAIAGLGQGWSIDEYDTANVPMKRRGAGFEEFIQAMRAVWAPDLVSFAGRFYRIPESEIGPKPVQPGGPPILIGSTTPAVVERAARVADGLNPTAASWAGLEQGVQNFRNAARAAGRPADTLPIVVRANTQISAQPAADPRPPLSGSIEQVREDVSRLSQLGIDHVFFNLGLTTYDITEQVRLLERLRAVAA